MMPEFPDRQPSFTPPGPAYVPDRSKTWPDGRPRTEDKDGVEVINVSDGSQDMSAVNLRQLRGFVGDVADTIIDNIDVGTDVTWEDVGVPVGSVVLPSQSAQYTGSGVFVGAGAYGNLTWDSFDGDDLLDLSNPAAPTVRTAGLYLVSVSLGSVATGASFLGQLFLDTIGAGAYTQAQSGNLVPVGGTGFVSLSCVYRIPAGGQITATVRNDDSSTRIFGLNEAVVNKLAVGPFDTSITALNHQIGFYEVEPYGGPSVAAGASVPNFTWTFAGAGAGTDLLETILAGPSSCARVKQAGLYAFNARVGFDPDPLAPFPANTFASLDMWIYNEPPPADYWGQQATTKWVCDNSQAGANINTVGFTRYMIPGDTQNQTINLGLSRHSTLAISNVSGFVSVQRIY